MPLSYSEVESLFRLGRFEEITSDASTSIRDIQKLPSCDHQLLVAESLLRTGKLESARHIARQLLNRADYARGHARCEMVLGIVARDLGRIDEAIQTLQHSLHLAREIGDIAQAARSALAIFRIASERQPPDVISPFLAEVRRLTTRAADPHITAWLHESVARQEAQVGNLQQARRHLRIATSLLASHPNAWLQQLCEINAFCIEFCNSDLQLAEDHLDRAKKLGAISGTYESTVLNNLGHLYLETGKFAKAERILNGLANCEVDEVRQSALDGLAKLYIATGRLSDCEHVIETLSGLQGMVQAEMPFPARSSLITRTRLLLNQAKWLDASHIAGVAIDESRKIADRNMLCAALMLRAQALVHAGRPVDASRAIAEASQLGAWTLRDHLGMFWQICSQIQQLQDVQRQWSNRAHRIWRLQGNACAESEVARIAKQSPPQASGAASHSKAQLESRVVSSLVSVFDLSHDAFLLGTELSEAIQAAECSAEVQIIKSRNATSSN